MAVGNIPQLLLTNLQAIEPDVEFTGSPPKVKSTSGKLYFVKTGSSAEKEQYIGEAESLKAIEAAAPEYKELDRLEDATAKILATRLAKELHAYESPQGFGFHVPTYCGATRLKNGWYESWEECFSAMIGYLLDQLSRRDSYRELCRKGEEVRNSVIPKLLGPLKIKPVLLHGDLWSGNVGVDNVDKQPVIFDPASFYGHNEADLAISRMFGGFPSSFYTTYHSLQSKSEPVDQYPLRSDLYELFHYLNHTVLFGGGYANSANKIMVELQRAVGQLEG